MTTTLPHPVSQSTSSQHLFPRTGKRGVPQQFPRRLYQMLESETKNIEACPTYPKIISWSMSGKAFHIYNVSDFASTILPKYFRTSKFSSFQRNLNLYGFVKVRRGTDTDMYAHPSFIRYNLDALVELRKVSGPVSSMTSPALFLPDIDTHFNNNTTTTTVDFNRVVRTSSQDESHVNTSPRLQRSVSPSNSTSSSVGTVSPYDSPVIATNNSKLYVPSSTAFNGMVLLPPTPRQNVTVTPPSPSPIQRVNLIVDDARKKASDDRGRLHLLTLALEYECFKANTIAQK